MAVAAGRAFSVGLRYDGTVIATGLNNSGQCYLETWNDIVAISAGGAITNKTKSLYIHKIYEGSGYDV